LTRQDFPPLRFSKFFQVGITPPNPPSESRHHFVCRKKSNKCKKNACFLGHPSLHLISKISSLLFVRTTLYPKPNTFFHPMDNSKITQTILVLSELSENQSQSTHDNPHSAPSAPPSPPSTPSKNGPTRPTAGLFPLHRGETAPPPSTTPPIASPWLFDPAPFLPSRGRGGPFHPLPSSSPQFHLSPLHHQN